MSVALMSISNIFRPATFTWMSFRNFGKLWSVIWRENGRRPLDGVNLHHDGGAFSCASRRAARRSSPARVLRHHVLPELPPLLEPPLLEPPLLEPPLLEPPLLEPPPSAS
jgi:hypothetical protein